MNLADMRSTFRTMVGGLADGDTDASINDRLNGAYQFTIPMDVPGELVESEWSLVASGGVGEYSYPATVAQTIQASPLLNDTYKLGYHTRPEQFWQTYQRTGGNLGRPEAALFYGRTLYLRPVPDTLYQVRVFTRAFPAALGSSGLDNRDHALAAVYAAAREYALDFSDDETAQKADIRYKDKRDLLITLSLTARSHERRRMRTF